VAGGKGLKEAEVKGSREAEGKALRNRRQGL
jgi:hypothetical protein